MTKKTLMNSVTAVNEFTLYRPQKLQSKIWGSYSDVAEYSTVLGRYAMPTDVTPQNLESSTNTTRKKRLVYSSSVG